MKKAKLAILVSGMIVASTISSMAIGITIDDKSVATDVAPYIQDGRTMVPISIISKELGATVEWNAGAKSIKINKDEKEIMMKIGDKNMLVNKSIVIIDASPIIKEGRTMVPLSAIAQAFGHAVNWNADTKVVDINTGPMGVRGVMVPIITPKDPVTPSVQTQTKELSGKVIEVLDINLIKVKLDSGTDTTIRLIGVSNIKPNFPSAAYNEKMVKESMEFLKSNLIEKEVELKYDPNTSPDSAYVTVKGVPYNINTDILLQGLAYLNRDDSNAEYYEGLEWAMEGAIGRGAGFQ